MKSKADIILEAMELIKEIPKNKEEIAFTREILDAIENAIENENYKDLLELISLNKG